MTPTDESNWGELEHKLKGIQKKSSNIPAKEWFAVTQSLNSLKNRKNAPFNPKQHDAQTKSTLARWFVIGYFFMLIIILIYVPIYNSIMVNLTKDTNNLLNAKDAFVMAAGQLGPLLGFVLGYYFKSQG